MMIQKSQNSKGFTLIELMAVVAIVAVLSAIAIPSYNSYIRNSARAQTQSTMLFLSNRLGEWKLKNTYAAFQPKDYAASSSSVYFLPKGSNNMNYKYMVKLVKKDNTALSTATVANSWYMYASPNPTGALKFADALYYNSRGEGCYIQRNNPSDAIPSDFATNNPCNKTTAKAWE